MEAPETDFGPGPASGAGDPLFFARIIGTVTWTCVCGRIYKRRLTPLAYNLLRCTGRNCGRVVHLTALEGYGGRDRHRISFWLR